MVGKGSGVKSEMGVGGVEVQRCGGAEMGCGVGRKHGA